ncbi:MAG: metallophosphoesterase family protein [Bacteroidia bacterium]
MERKIAVSDIHGCVRTLRRLLEKKVRLTHGDELYLLGDYINRGPDSPGVIAYIRQLRREGFPVYCLMGNHEDRYIRTPGSSTSLHMVPDLRAFWGELRYWIEVDDYILVHAGLNFRAPDPWSDTTAMMYIRDWHRDLDPDWLDGRIVIHGHVRHTVAQIEAMVARWRYVIAIDAGCSFAGVAGQGYLCALDFSNREVFFQKNIDV